MRLLYLDPRLLDADEEGVRDDPGDISGLAATIAERGLLQPLGVVETGQGRYRVVYGGRRRAAALHLGLEKVPCILLDIDDPDLLLRQLIENVQREDLNDMEQSRAFARLRARIAAERGPGSEGDLDEAVGKEVGLSGRTVRRYLGLLDLPDEVQHLIRRGELNVTQAQHLRRIPNRRTQIELAQAAAEEGMSAAELGRLANYFVANPNLTLETALQALEQGAQLRDRPLAEVQIMGGSLGKTSVSAVDRPEKDNFWADEDAADESGNSADGEFLSVDDDETIENQPANKARVFRIRSLDQLVDETDRMSRAFVDGELQKWAERDEAAPFKVRLVLRQLEKLISGLREIVDKQGWERD
ncbi:MAG: ParB/RepB/Spo0J family partition protein [Chloroflexaceae bacterium]|nr:ParB/RepB/Spo0J family partition protein [Chloroflexaceae bacterium]